MTTNDIPKIDESTMRRLKKLMALAADSAAAPGEAANAMRMAQALMAKYNVTEGAVVSSEIEEFSYKSTKAVSPPPWEGRLIAELCRAFGARCYWSGGAGFRGFRDKGHWHVLAEKRQLLLIQYAFDVIRRQLIRDRAKFVATLPEWMTRPRKAAEGDAFGLAYVKQLSKKISTFSGQDERVTRALEAKITEICGGNKLKNRVPNASDAARQAGAAAGAGANLHRPMSGAAERLKIGA